jgi:hypothetical protein
MRASSFSLSPSLKRIRLTAFLASIAGMTLAGFFSQNAAAYNLEGPRWSGQPTSGCCAHLYLQYAAALYPGDSTVYDNGRFAWNNTASANIFFYTASSSSIYATDQNNSSASWDGRTTYTYSGGYFTHATVELNYYYFSTLNYPAEKKQGVAAHELGHVAGLAHTSGCVLMTPYSDTRWDTCGIKTPQTDDVNGLNSLY